MQTSTKTDTEKRIQHMTWSCLTHTHSYLIPSEIRACIKCGDLEALKFLFEHAEKYGYDVNSNVDDEPERYHTTPLLYAAEFGTAEIIEWLLHNGANVREQSWYTMNGEERVTDVIELATKHRTPYDQKIVDLFGTWLPGGAAIKSARK